MGEWFAKVLFILAFWRRPDRRPRKRSISRAKDIEETGRWYFRRDILDRLDDFLKTVRHLKHYDPDCFDLYSRIGGCVASPHGMYEWQELSPLWTSDLLPRPAFGMCHFTKLSEDTKEKIYPRCVYFHKMHFVPGVQAFQGTLYELVVFWHRMDKRPGKGAVITYHVRIDSKGKVRVLKERIRVYCPLPNSHRQGPPKICWEYPTSLVDWTLENKNEWKGEGGPQGLGSFMFIYCANLCEQATADIRIRAEKNGIPAVFSVDLLRTPYFFEGRDKVKVDGYTKKIFHIVRTHERRLKTGRRTYVRSHFRGQRKFMWNGYRVTITMPGFHHKSLATIGWEGRHLEEGVPIPKGLVGAKEVGEKIRKATVR